jgi:hypothetical protein
LLIWLLLILLLLLLFFRSVHWLFIYCEMVVLWLVTVPIWFGDIYSVFVVVVRYSTC